ncbi:hypothetical protein CHS0354_040624 [Potamilus streckersoni]|uniref:Fibronectin type-III domain-containing protein n=1 Tax=Potamilus streckersoni TaxID=2493646 RepID=A0AAE0SHB1_9BIVA|nr:hypothetical protein CHS0354_040624 [Potamilus streckersoni]
MPDCFENSIQYYELKYKIIDEKRWLSVTTPDNSNSFRVEGLRSNTCYEFKVRAIFDDEDEGPFSESNKETMTKQSVSETILHEARKIRDDQPATYKLILKEDKKSVNFKAKTRRCIFGDAPKGNLIEKTIMVVGATGSGKSTLIDGIVNYVMDVEWKDDWRFTIIDLKDVEKKKKNNQSESQTEWITCYTIHSRPGSRIKYTLNIIDTPGFGDTRGFERDQAIVEQIRLFFTTPPPKGIYELDAVCFVTQAPLARLTPHQKYIFDSVLSLFGKDMSKNIFVLVTFADGNDPPVKKALEAAEVPFQRAFKFNNSALFASTNYSEEARFGQMFWDMGKESFNVFFTELRKTKTRSLQLTADVLKTRKQLEAIIEGLQPQIMEGLNVINTIKQEKRVIEQHKADIVANKEFEYEVEEIHQRKITLAVGEYVTNCLTCNRTCHYPCSIPKDNEKKECAAMDRSGYCTNCPKHCIWSQHVNNQYRFEFFPQKIKRTSEDLKRRYDIAQGKEREHSIYLQTVKAKFDKVGSNVFAMIKRVRDCIIKLQEKAIKQNPLSQVEYIKLLIDGEKREAKYGWQKRVEMLKKFKKQAELLEDIPNQEYRPWTDEEVELLLQ